MGDGTGDDDGLVFHGQELPFAIELQAGSGTDGGDIVLRPGQTSFVSHPRGVDGSIIFQRASGDEIFRLDPDGKVLVRGNVVTSDLAMYHAFAEWLTHANVGYGKRKIGES